MIVMSIISSTVLILIVLIYKYIYPKKEINLLYLLILISLLPLFSILRPGGYESGDLVPHTKISMMFYRALTHGEIIPQWSDIVCGGYGCPYFNFIYILPYYITGFFHFLGFSFVSSVKLLLATTFIASGITVYVWIKDEFGKTAGFIAGLFYLFAPYHLVDLHFRNAVGEMAAFALLPLCFFFTKKIIIQTSTKWILANAIAITLLMFSHLTALVMTLPFLTIYAIIVLFRKKQKQLFKLIFLGLSFLLALLLSCFYWLPIIFEGKYIFWGVQSSLTFYPLADLLYSPWRYGLLFQGPYGEHSHLVGYTQLGIIFLGVYFLVKHKISNGYQKTILLFFLIAFCITFFMILPISKPIWYTIPFIKSFQFSYRLLMFSALAISVIAAIVLTNIANKKIVITICFLTIFLTILNWGNRKVIPEINDDSIRYILLNNDYGRGELTSPIWINDNPIYSKHRPLSPQLETLSGKTSIIQLNDHPTKHEYVVNAQTNARLKDNTFYYPGWKVTANNTIIPIDFQDKNYPGTLVFNLKEGLYKVTIELTDTYPRKIGKIVSLATFSILILYILIRFSNSRFIKKNSKKVFEKIIIS